MSKSFATLARHPARAAVVLALGLVALLVAVMNAGAAPPSTFMELGIATTFQDKNVRFDASGTGSFDWANGPSPACSHPATGTQTCPGSGGLFNGGVFIGNTTPPTPPSPTANGTVGTNNIDAIAFGVDSLVGDSGELAPGTTTACGKGDSTVYTGAGGEKNGDALIGKGVETYALSSVPPKDDVQNIYAVSRSGFGTSSDGKEVFFGGERNFTTGQGDSHFDFEFTQANVTLVNLDACSSSHEGDFNGHRTHGDFVASIEYTQGGELGGFELNQWHCNADTHSADSGPGWVNDATANPSTLTGTVCDAKGSATPCSTPTATQLLSPVACGSGPHYQLIACVSTAVKGASACPPITGVPAGVADSVNAVTNDAGSVECGGWACRASDGSLETTVDTNKFFEGGVNLKSLGFTGCLSTFIPHTRSSQSFTATLKDFQLIPFNTCKAAIEVAKVDTSDPPKLLKGACFNFVFTGTTTPADSVTNPVCDGDSQDKDSADGKVCIEGLTSGSYTIHETTAPGGYSLDRVDKTVVIPSPITTNTTCPKTSVDKTFVDPLGTLSVKKTDSAANLVGGATFKVTPNPFYCTSGLPGGTPSPKVNPNTGSATVKDGDTTAASLSGNDATVPDPDGTANGVVTLSGVCIGSYTVTEAIAPGGYSLDPTNPRSCAVADTGVTATEQKCTVTGFTTPGLTFVDPLGKLKIVKKDKNTGLVVGGATFKIEPNPFYCTSGTLGGTPSPGPVPGSGFITIRDGATDAGTTVDPNDRNDPDGAADGDITFTDGICIGHYKVTETVAPPGGYLIDTTPGNNPQECDVADPPANPVQDCGTLTFQDFRGSIIIRKEAKDASTPCVSDGPGCHDLLGGATFQIKPNPTALPDNCTGFVGSCRQVTDNGPGDAFNTTAGLICIDSVSAVPGSFSVKESAAPANYAKASPDTQTGITAVGDTCGNRTTSAAADVTFVNTPLSRIQVIFTSLAGVNVTKASIVCADATPATVPAVSENGAADPALDDTNETFGNGTSTLVPGTYTCTIVIDP